MSFLTTSRAPPFADPKIDSGSLHLALPQQSLYSFPDPQGHLSLGFGMGHLQLLASYIEHYILRFPRTKNFCLVQKRPEPLELRDPMHLRGFANGVYQSDVLCR
jgi:hypothetical protein